MSSISDLRKQVIDLQVLSLKKNCSQAFYNEMEDKIRQQATELLHSLDPSITYLDHYNGPIICDTNGSFKANVAFISRLRLAVDKLTKNVTDVPIQIEEPRRGASGSAREIGMKKWSSPQESADTPEKYYTNLDTHIIPRAQRRATPKATPSPHVNTSPRLERQNRKLAESVAQMKYKIRALKEELGIEDVEDTYKNTDLFVVRYQRILQKLKAQEETYNKLVEFQSALENMIPELEREKDSMLTEACINAVSNYSIL